MYGTRRCFPPVILIMSIRVYTRIPHVYRKVLTREGEHVYIVNADRWPRLAYIYSVYAFILALEPIERQKLVGLENVCPGFHGDVSSISNNPGGGESGYSSCTDLTKPRHGPSRAKQAGRRVWSTDHIVNRIPIRLCFPISCRFFDSRGSKLLVISKYFSNVP